MTYPLQEEDFERITAQRNAALTRARRAEQDEENWRDRAAFMQGQLDAAESRVVELGVERDEARKLLDRVAAIANESDCGLCSADQYLDHAPDCVVLEITALLHRAVAGHTDPTPPTCPTCGRGGANKHTNPLIVRNRKAMRCTDPWHTDPTDHREKGLNDE